MSRPEKAGLLEWPTCVGLMLVLAGCYQTYLDLGDGEHEADAPADVVADATDAEIAVVPDGDADDAVDVAEVDGETCAGGWLDPTTGLCWQDPPDETGRDRDDAASYCADLVLGGLDDWRLPTIGELRSLLRECPETESGGPCGIVDDCLEWDCWTHDCVGCLSGSGPGTDGTHLSSGLHGSRYDYWRDYWSSSVRTDLFPASWTVEFVFGRVDNYYWEAERSVRCVRHGP